MGYEAHEEVQVMDVAPIATLAVGSVDVMQRTEEAAHEVKVGTTSVYYCIMCMGFDFLCTCDILISRLWMPERRM